jgi:hypothetical protein
VVEREHQASEEDQPVDDPTNEAQNRS